MAVEGLSAPAMDSARSRPVAELIGGLTVWAMLVPQCLGYSTLAGLDPVHGLYAAAGAMALYWVRGTSSVLNVGPESTVAIMVAASLGARDLETAEYASQAATLAVLVATMLAIGGALRLGWIADLLSRPVLTGYVFGSGLIIVGSQLLDLVGITPGEDDSASNLVVLVRRLGEVDAGSVSFAAGTVVVMVALRRFMPLVPGALVAVVLSGLAVALGDPEVPVVGAFDGGVPVPQLPAVDLSVVTSLLFPALAIAALVYPDSMLTARSIAKVRGERIDANREFFGLGAANLGAGLLGGFPVNGSQSRSFVLDDSGARSQVANLVAAALLVATILFLSPLFDFLPSATLAGIVVVAGIGLLDVGEFAALWRYRRSEAVMAILTVIAVLAIGVLEGIVVAVVLSVTAVVIRAARPGTAQLGLVAGTDSYRSVDRYPEALVDPRVFVYRSDAPLFFANATYLCDEIRDHVRTSRPSYVIWDFGAVTDVDSTGAQAVVELLDELDDSGCGLVIARARSSVVVDLDTAGVIGRLAGPGTALEVDDAVAALEGGPVEGTG